MWIMTTIGFFSVVQKSGEEGLTIRSRVENDLKLLKQKYLPEAGEIIKGAGTDYPYRIRVSHNDWAQALSKIAMDIHYSNFKSAVYGEQGSARASTYGKVWGVLHELQESEKNKSRLAAAYGGVVFNDKGQILLRKPRNEYDGYVWTFAKGRPDKGESAEEAAMREVAEENFCKAEIIGAVPGEFAGGTTTNQYFLMRIVKELPFPDDDKETESLRWCTPDDASKFISMTRNATGKKRDLAVLDSAIAAAREHDILTGDEK